VPGPPLPRCSHRRFPVCFPVVLTTLYIKRVFDLQRVCTLHACMTAGGPSTSCSAVGAPSGMWEYCSRECATCACVPARACFDRTCRRHQPTALSLGTARKSHLRTARPTQSARPWRTQGWAGMPRRTPLSQQPVGWAACSSTPGTGRRSSLLFHLHVLLFRNKPAAAWHAAAAPRPLLLPLPACTPRACRVAHTCRAPGALCAGRGVGMYPRQREPQ
jgi:hypothetical protein